MLLLDNQSHPLPEPLKIQLCNTFATRLKGLMFRRVLPHDQALWFIGDRENRLDSAIHMLFMNFNIAVVWLDHDANVVDVRLAKRWHPWYIPTGYAKYILEASETNIDSFHIGDHIILYEA